MTAPLRLAVVGLGPMGLHHARAIADVPGARLCAVADTDRARADAAAHEFACCAVHDARELVGTVDAAIIATPPASHAAVAVPLLNAGIACLVEKPLALSDADCAAITAAAAHAVVAVGHIERFNPATEALFAAGLDGAAIRALTARRFSPAAGRQVPVDVVSDMMIHDLDIVLALKNSPVVALTAEGVPDAHATATLRFTDGSTASLAADRKAASRVRELLLDTAAGPVRLDFMARTVMRGAASLPVTAHDALRAEIGDFVRAAATGGAPRVGAAAAAAAMGVARAILAAMRGPRP